MGPALASLAESLQQIHSPEEVVDFLMVRVVNALVTQLGLSFADASHLPLESNPLSLEPAQCRALADLETLDWTQIEPEFLGALFEETLALNPRKRKRLGAHYTPRIQVERLVIPTLIAPLRQDWEACINLAEVDEFLDRLSSIRVLDPACGTGNILCTSYLLLREFEREVLAYRASLVGAAPLERAAAVGVHQLIGIEIDPAAARVARVVLWMAHVQDVHRSRELAGRVKRPTIEVRDALVQIGSETRRSSWPYADFIVGNPPFMGNKVMRSRLGASYVQTLRALYPTVPDSVDFVMFWWHRAAELVRCGSVRRFGFITTNSITQSQNRQVIQAHLDAPDRPLRLLMAIADHPWIDAGAAVRIAMTVGGCTSAEAVVSEVVEGLASGQPVVIRHRRVPVIHADLRADVDVTQAVVLRSNQGLSFQGMNLVGKGFRLTGSEVQKLGFDVHNLPPIIKPYLSAREMMQVRHHRYVIDAYGLTAAQLQSSYPGCYRWLEANVKPQRDQNNRPSRRKNWWLFGETVPRLRTAWSGLERFLITPETSKHRVFDWCFAGTIPDHTLYAIVLPTDAHFGVLQSRIHRVWSLRTGGRLVDRPRYNNTRCFLRFPFPDGSETARHDVGESAGLLLAHRQALCGSEPGLTLTQLANQVGSSKSASNDIQHMRALEHRLNDAVARAYGWPVSLSETEILAELVALNLRHAAREQKGEVPV